MSPTSVPSAGGRLVTLDGRELPLRATSIAADCAAGLGRIELQQVFHNPHAEPLRVTYQVPLPADGAVTGYRFRFGDEEVVGRVEPKAKARAQFEEAILEGRTAALLEEDRSSLFTQEVGNIPPDAEVVITITVDQRLTWVREPGRAGWEWRFPTVVGPRYLGAPGRVPDAPRIVTTHTEDDLPVAIAMELTIRDEVLGQAESPSHALALGATIRLAAENAALDRDVVVRWPVAGARPGVSLDVARPAEGHARADEAFALLTVTPPHTTQDAVPRDLIVLLDTSGSMGGQPLDQAKKVTAALIDSLGPQDRLELIEFSMRARRWQAEAVFATDANRAAAQRWLASLRAGGGTEMKTGLLEAMSGLRPEAQRQIVLVSDGYIGFEAEIVGAILQGLPRGSRLHTLGVGSAVNRSLTQPSARAGRGIEIIIGIDEDPERATQRLLAATEEPVLVDLTVEGDALLDMAPARPHDLYAGAPALLLARVEPEGGTLLVTGRTATGAWEQRLSIPATGPDNGSKAVPALYAREAVEDFETRRAAGETGDLDRLVERFGVEFQISTRLTSWVAISRARTVDPTKPTRNTTVPHAIPHGTSVAGFGLRAAGEMTMDALSLAGPGGPPLARGRAAPASPKRKLSKREERQRGAVVGAAPPAASPPPPPASAPSPKPVPPAHATPVSKGALADGAEGGFDDMDDEVMAEEAAAPMLYVDGGPLKLAGKWTRVGDRWVFTFVVPEGGLEWKHPTTVKVALADGTVHELALARGSTAAGIHAAGVLIRVVIDVPSTLIPQTPISFEVGEELRVELDA